MIGSIIGDIVGSVYEVEEVNAIKNNPNKKRDYSERIKILDKSVPLFTSNCSYTDDTVLTLAIADAVINYKDYENNLREFGKRELLLGKDKYGRSRFGKGFIEWLKNKSKGISYGNGSAMRISPVGFLFDDIKSIKEEVYKATIPSHNNEDAIRKSISIGGDSDTIACIVGGISEAYYGVPTHLKKEIYKYLQLYQALIVKEFYFKRIFLDLLKDEYKYSKHFKTYIKDHIKVLDYISSGKFGCYENRIDGKLTEFNLVVPRLLNKDALLINIKEFYNAMNLYWELYENIKQDNKEQKKLKKEKKGE